MKNRNLLNYLMPRRSMRFAFSMAALLVLGSSVFAQGQVQADKVRVVPTVEGDETTEMNFGLHVTDSAASSGGQPIMLNKNETNQIDECKTNAWAEYQIIAPEGGKFICTALGTSAKNGALLNIGAYKTETESWPETGLGDTVAVENNGKWDDSDLKEYNFIMDLEAGVFYTVRITFLREGGDHNWTLNLFNGLSFRSAEGSIEDHLSDLKIDGQTIEGFDPEVFSYYIPLPPYMWIQNLEATALDATATVVLPEDLAPGESGNVGNYVVSCTSEAGTTKEYKIKVISPVLIDDGVMLRMADDVYFSKGINTSATKVNNINNNDYIDYYIYSEFDDNYLVTLNTALGYETTASYLNLSTLPVGDTTWVLDPLKSKNIPTTRNEAGAGSWNTADAIDVEFVVSVKAEVPTLFRIYGVTNVGNAADIFSMTFKLLDPSIGIDATLSDLQVDGVTLEQFDPAITSYDVALPVGATSVLTAATATDATAELSGAGVLDLDGSVSRDTISVKSASGFAMDYKVNFYAPTEIGFALTDTFPLFMGDNMFNTSGIRVSNTVINYFSDSLYVDYYIYSAEDKDMHVVANIANGTADTIVNTVNISTYTYGEEWALDNGYTLNIVGAGEGLWGAEFATEYKYNVSLKAGEPVMLRIFGRTTGGGAADIHRLGFVEGHSGTTAVKSVAKGNLNVWGSEGSVNVTCNDSFVGGSIQIFDISGRLVSSELMASTKNVYSLERSGLYIVKAISTNNVVTTTKCLVK